MVWVFCCCYVIKKINQHGIYDDCVILCISSLPTTLNSKQIGNPFVHIPWFDQPKIHSNYLLSNVMITYHIVTCGIFTDINTADHTTNHIRYYTCLLTTTTTTTTYHIYIFTNIEFNKHNSDLIGSKRFLAQCRSIWYLVCHKTISDRHLCIVVLAMVLI